MAKDQANVYLLAAVAVVSIIALFTIYVNMNNASSVLFPEETIAGEAYKVGGEPGSSISNTNWKNSPAASDPVVIKYFFNGDIENVKKYKPR